MYHPWELTVCSCCGEVNQYDDSSWWRYCRVIHMGKKKRNVDEGLSIQCRWRSEMSYIFRSRWCVCKRGLERRVVQEIEKVFPACWKACGWGKLAECWDLLVDMDYFHGSIWCGQRREWKGNQIRQESVCQDDKDIFKLSFPEGLALVCSICFSYHEVQKIASLCGCECLGNKIVSKTSHID